MRLVLAFFLILLEAHQTWSVNFGLYPYVEILVADRKPAWFDDKSGPVAKWIRRRFPTPEIASSSPARVDNVFYLQLSLRWHLKTAYQIERRVTRFAIVKTRGHESLLATEVTKYIQMSSSHLSTLSSLWEEPFS